MAPVRSSSSAFRNILLRRLPEEDRAALLPHLVPMDLPVGLELLSPNSSIEWVYLLERGLASMSASTRDGRSVEIGMMGREGVVGVSALFGHRPLSHTAMMQGSGDGHRIRTGIFQNQMAKSTVLLQGVNDALHIQMASFAQSGVCNAMHEVEPRLCRWLLTASDLTEVETMDLTHEFLATMLGTRRTSVSKAAGALQRAGLITYQRGHLTIVNRSMLERAACECYGILRDAYKQTFPEKWA